MEKLTCNVTDTALVFEGGGYRAAYTAGFANVLLEHDVNFAYACGISAGASHTVDYISRDKKRIRDSFIELTDKRPRAGGVRSALTGHSYFNADYIYVGAEADGLMPFDWEMFEANPAQLRIQAFDATTGETITWARKDMPTKEDMMNLVRMSSTLPGIMKPITYQDDLMYDGGLGEGAGLPLRLAEIDGYERFFFVATRVAGYRKKQPTAATLRLYRRLSKGNEHLYKALATRTDRYNAELDRIEALERAGKAFIARPEIMPVSSTTIQKPRLLEAYALGHEQAERDWPRWQEFIFG